MDFTTEVRDEILEMVQDMRIKPSLSSPPKKKYGRASLKIFLGGRGEGGGLGVGLVFYMGFNIRLGKEGRKVSQMHFLVI